MTIFKTMLFITKRCAYQTEEYVIKRSFSCSVICNANDKQDISLELDTNKNLKKEQKLLKVAMLGLPNVGKSTLINQLTHRSICPTSSKVHTTMHKSEVIYNEGNTQIIFIDTPGITTLKEIKTYKLMDTFNEDPQTSAKEADVIGIIQDVTNVYTRHKIDNVVLNYVKNKRNDAQLLLILNKVDRLKKKEALLNLVKILTTKEDYPKFDDIFMISAFTGDGINDLRNYLVDSSKVQEWKYKENFFTDQPIENIIQETVRAKLMDILPNEMPYKVNVTMEHFDFGDDGSVSAFVSLNCPKENYLKVLLTGKAFKIKCLSFHVEKELRHAFRTNVSVRINVQTKKRMENNE